MSALDTHRRPSTPDTLSIPVERGLLGLLLVDPAAVGHASVLDPADFLDVRHRLVFETILDLTRHGLDLSPVALVLEMERRGTLAAAGGAEYMAGLVADERALPRLRDHLIAKVREEALRRRATHDLERAVRSVADRTTPLGYTFAELRGELAAVERGELDEGDGFASLAALMARLRALSDAPSDDPRLPTLIGPLDEKLRGGMAPAQLLVVAGLTGSGKTGLGTQIALGSAWYMAQNPERYRTAGRILYFSFEMTADEIGLRMIQQVRDIQDGWEPMRGGWTARDRARAYDALRVLEALPLNVTESSITSTLRPSTDAVAAAIERHRARHGTPPLIVVDHMHLLRVEGAHGRTEEVERIVTSLKGVAMESRIPVLLLAQMNRESQRRENPRPKLSDLKDSAAIEQTANVVMFVHRPDQAALDESDDDAQQDEPQRAALIVAKHRGGKQGTIPLTWVGRRTLFVPDPAWQPRLPGPGRDAPALFEWPVLPQGAAATPPAPPSDAALVLDMVRTSLRLGRRATRADLKTGAAALGRDATSSWSSWWAGRAVEQLLRTGQLLGQQSRTGTRAWTYWLPACSSDAQAAGPTAPDPTEGSGSPAVDALDDDIAF